MRVYTSLNYINANAEKRIPFYNLIRLVIIHLFISHYYACIMYSIAYYEVQNNPGQNMVNFIFPIKLLKTLLIKKDQLYR